MKKIHLPDVLIEITRKCNMVCSHCLRGDAENLDLDVKYVENLFKRVYSIGTLTLTGGEPSLNPSMINNIVRLAKKHKVDIGNFYIATNGKKVSSEFIMAVMNLYLYCSDNEVSMVDISDDHFHELSEENAKKLEILKFVNRKGDIADKNLISQGNAKWNYPCERELNIHGYDLENGEVNEGMVYLNCLGNILPCCDLSYETQNEKNLILGNIMDEKFDLLEGMKKFNEILEKSGKSVEAIVEYEMEKV